MRKPINIFFDFEFTSISPDAQPISLGIVAEEPELLSEPKYQYIPAGALGKNSVAFHNWYDDKELGHDVTLHDADYTKEKAFEYFMYFLKKKTKTFYAEFYDYDINRCDDWVKENVVKKLKYNDWADTDSIFSDFDNLTLKSSTEGVIESLLFWLKKQFKDYDIQFIGDCATWDWYHLLQLIGKWETGSIWNDQRGFNMGIAIGLPKLPNNISPVVQDINDLIAYKKGISVREAFDLDREEMVKPYLTEKYIQSGKHNALFDADVIKEIFNEFQDDKD